MQYYEITTRIEVSADLAEQSQSIAKADPALKQFLTQLKGLSFKATQTVKIYKPGKKKGDATPPVPEQRAAMEEMEVIEKAPLQQAERRPDPQHLARDVTPLTD